VTAPGMRTPDMGVGGWSRSWGGGTRLRDDPSAGPLLDLTHCPTTGACFTSAGARQRDSRDASAGPIPGFTPPAPRWPGADDVLASRASRASRASPQDALSSLRFPPKLMPTAERGGCHALGGGRAQRVLAMVLAASEAMPHKANEMGACG
jgi:hypothetical protein